MAHTAIIRRKLSAVLYGTGKALKANQIRKCSGKGFNHQAAEKAGDLLRAELIWKFQFVTGHYSECRKWTGEQQPVAWYWLENKPLACKKWKSLQKQWLLRTGCSEQRWLYAVCIEARSQATLSIQGCWLGWALPTVSTPKLLKSAAHTRNFRDLLLSSNLLKKIWHYVQFKWETI